jgi:hypothetical protein
MICDEKEALCCLYSEAIVALYRADVQFQRLKATADNDEYERLLDFRREGHRILEQVRNTLENHILQHGCGDFRPGLGAAPRL